jgi:hypothetical protein
MKPDASHRCGDRAAGRRGRRATHRSDHVPIAIHAALYARTHTHTQAPRPIYHTSVPTTPSGVAVGRSLCLARRSHPAPRMPPPRDAPEPRPDAYPHSTTCDTTLTSHDQASHQPPATSHQPSHQPPATRCELRPPPRSPELKARMLSSHAQQPGGAHQLAALGALGQLACTARNLACYACMLCLSS